MRSAATHATMCIMKIVIFEGIATSGKSTVINGLRDALLPTCRVTIADESMTHEPIMEQRAELHEAFFRQLILSLAKTESDVLLFDRLYLTQAFRAKANLAAYSKIEKMLSGYEVTTVMLYVQEAAIADRIAKAAEHREPEWGAYVKTRGSSADDIANYYITQQRGLLDLIAQSKLPHAIFDTTEHEYEPLVEILRDMCEESK